MPDEKNVSSLIKSNIEILMRDWTTAVRSELPGTLGLSPEDLMNGLPDFLANLAFYFSVQKGSAEWERALQQSSEMAKQHGRQRAACPGFTLDQVIVEHQILRRILFDFLQKRARLEREQWNTLLQSVDVGISAAATAFALERGFRDARYRKLESEKDETREERNLARSEIGNLESERAIREQFVSTLSHDLRTPITSAKTTAELIAREPGNEKRVARLAFKIIDDLSRSDRMIRDLLDANRIRAGEKLPLEFQETKLLELISKTLGSLAKVYGDRFVLHADHEIVGFWSSKDLERSLENLAINAVKYGAADSPIDIRVIDHDDTVTLSVHNLGSLITEAEQEALFQPYSRILNEKKVKGWGLGLTLVLGITEAHGGTIHVESDAKKGTTFTMVIPKDARTREGQAA